MKIHGSVLWTVVWSCFLQAVADVHVRARFDEQISIRFACELRSEACPVMFTDGFRHENAFFLHEEAGQRRAGAGSARVNAKHCTAASAQ